MVSRCLLSWFVILVVSGWRALWSGICDVEAMGCIISVSWGRRLEARWKRPENRGQSRWRGFESKNELIRCINASFVPLSDSLSAPAISCKSPLFFEAREPVKASSGWRAWPCSWCWSCHPSVSQAWGDGILPWVVLRPFLHFAVVVTVSYTGASRGASISHINRLTLWRSLNPMCFCHALSSRLDYSCTSSRLCMVNTFSYMRTTYNIPQIFPGWNGTICRISTSRSRIHHFGWSLSISCHYGIP